MSSVHHPILDELQLTIGERHVRTDEDSLNYYGTDWTRFIDPNPLAIVFPGSLEEVVKVVNIARRNNVAIVPSGGRTGLSAGAVASAGELVVSS